MATQGSEEIRNRLARMEGQVRGIMHMIEEEREPIEVLRLISAVRAALDSVGAIILSRHMEECVAEASLDGTASEDEVRVRVKKVKDALEQFIR